jgi:hypothetical protein
MHPLSKQHISKCLKIWKKYLGVHADILCSHTNYRGKKDIFVAWIKKTIFGALK